MTKSLVFSLNNENFKEDKDILLAGEWVLECSQNNIRNTKFDIFYSKSDQKNFRIQNSLQSNKIYQSILKTFYLYFIVNQIDI